MTQSQLSILNLTFLSIVSLQILNLGIALITAIHAICNDLSNLSYYFLMFWNIMTPGILTDNTMKPFIAMIAAISCFRRESSDKQPKKHDLIVDCSLGNILSFL